MDNSNVNQLIDIYDVWYQPWWKTNFFYGWTVFLLFVLAALLVYIFWKKYMQGQQFSYEQIALLQLQRLHDISYDSEEAIRDSYFQMTMIMKTYLSKRYEVGLLNKTDNEIVDVIKPFVSIEIFATLQELFIRAHQIKFANAAISLKMLYDDIDYMQRIIYKTVKQDGGARDF